MKAISEAIVLLALIAAAVALIITGHGEWVIGLLLLGMFYLG